MDRPGTDCENGNAQATRETLSSLDRSQADPEALGKSDRIHRTLVGILSQHRLNDFAQ
jgi:hypothetical protein